MKLFILLSGLLFVNFCSASDATNTMAQIMIQLNHFPSAEDKNSLQAISANTTSSDAEKILAGIIGRIAHKPAAADVATLEVMSADSSAPEIQILAQAILGTMHKPDAASLKALNTLVSE